MTDQRPLCSADGCHRHEPCGPFCQDRGNLAPAIPERDISGAEEGLGAQTFPSGKIALSGYTAAEAGFGVKTVAADRLLVSVSLKFEFGVEGGDTSTGSAMGSHALGLLDAPVQALLAQLYAGLQARFGGPVDD